MIAVAQEMMIRCYDSLDKGIEAPGRHGNVELFFAEASDLGEYYSVLRGLNSEKEIARADKFVSEGERLTYIACHAMLRLLLSARLNVIPENIVYSAGVYNKPGIAGDPFYFNISHTKKAFAIAVSSTGTLGLDIEDMDRKVDIPSVTGSYFSTKEMEYTMRSESGPEESFFKLWTRKEALLKAMGTGIIDELKMIEVSAEENSVNPDLFNKNYCRSGNISDYFIYSEMIGRHYLSLAIPSPQPISFTRLNSLNINTFLD